MPTVHRLSLAWAAVALISTPLASWAPQDPTVQPLLAQTDLVYEGQFCGPSTSGAFPESLHDGGEAMGYDETNNQIILMGNLRYGDAVRINIPTPSLSSCPRATAQGAWLDMQWRFPGEDPAANDVRIGGFYPLSNGDMIISAYVYYDASATQIESHVRRQANGTILPAISDWTRVGNSAIGGVSYQAGFVSGWMLPVPSLWQGLIGAPALTGNGEISIVSRTSLGPALATFDPADIDGINQTVSSTQLLAYDINHPTLGTCETGTTFNCASSNQRAGMVWPIGTRTILHFHQVCPVDPVYIGGWTCPGGRVTRVLAYDANDLVSVKTAALAPYEPIPYGIWDIGSALDDNVPVAVAYNSSTDQIYVAQRYGDGPQPSIHVYSVTTPGAGGGGSRIIPPGLIPNLQQISDATRRLFGPLAGMGR